MGPSHKRDCALANQTHGPLLLRKVYPYISTLEELIRSLQRAGGQVADEGTVFAWQGFKIVSICDKLSLIFMLYIDTLSEIRNFAAKHYGHSVHHNILNNWTGELVRPGDHPDYCSLVQRSLANKNPGATIYQSSHGNPLGLSQDQVSQCQQLLRLPQQKK